VGIHDMVAKALVLEGAKPKDEESEAS
jgi:hypothetical protein